MIANVWRNAFQIAGKLDIIIYNFDPPSNVFYECNGENYMCR